MKQQIKKIQFEKTTLALAVSLALYGTVMPGAACTVDGATITVTAGGDAVDAMDGVTTLREAVNTANADALCDQIEFAAGLNGQTITVDTGSNGGLQINHPLNIAGPGSAQLTLSNTGAGTLLSGEDVNLSVSGLTFSAVSETAIAINGNTGPVVLALDDVVIENSGSSSYRAVVYDGADAPGSIFTMSDSVIDNSQGIAVSGAETITINSTVLQNNTIASNPGDPGRPGGGARLNGKNIGIDQVTVNNNTANDTGGGLYITDLGDDSLVSISRSTISGNTAQGSGGGMHLNSFTGDLTIDESTIADNQSEFQGNGLYVAFNNSGNTVTIRDSHVTGNTKVTASEGSGGGGIYLFDSGLQNTVTIQASNISNNESDNDGAGIYLQAGVPQLTIIDSTISNNLITENGNGGGLYVGANEGGMTLDIRGSTISGNRETSPLSAGKLGGGIMIDGIGTADDNVSIVNSTISGNSTDESGGGIYMSSAASSTVNIAHTTITGNAVDEAGGPGIYGGGATVNLDHAIVAGNTSTAGPANDLGGATYSLYYSFIGESSQSFPPTYSMSVMSNENGGDPPLEPLADNGGPTQTHLPTATGALVNAGDNTLVAGVGDTPATDQRGSHRVVGSAIDIGAVEYNRPPVLDTAITAATATAGTPFSFDLSNFFSDPDMDALSYSITSTTDLPGAIAIAGSIVSATFAAGDVGSYTINYQVCDSNGLCITGSGALTVSAATVNSPRSSGGGGGGGSFGGGLLLFLMSLLGWRRRD